MLKKQRTPQTRPQLVDDSSFSTSQESVPVAVTAGERLLAVKWVSQVYRLRSVQVDGGKKGAGTYNWYGTIAGVFGQGPFDELVAILQDGTSVWPTASAWVAQTWSAHSVVYYLGDFYKTDSSTAAVPPASPWYRYSLPASSANSSGYSSLGITYQQVSYGTIRVYWGSLTQSADPVLTDSTIMGEVSVPGSATPQIHPAYRGVGYLVLDDYLFGQDNQNPPNLQVIVRRTPKQTIVSGSSATLTDGQANLVAFSADLLTDKRYGIGLDASNLDSTSFQAAADTLNGNVDLTAGSPVLEQQEQLGDVCQLIQGMTDSWLRFNAVTGKIEAGVWKHGVTPTSGTYATVTMTQLTQRPKITEKGWAEANTAAIVSFPDRTRLFHDSPTPPAVDVRARDAVQTDRETTQSRPWVTTLQRAQAQAQEWMRYNGRPPGTIELVVRRAFAIGFGAGVWQNGIRPGDWLLVDVEPEPGGTQILQFCRVSQRRIPRTGPVTITATFDPTLSPTIYQPPSDPLPLTQANEPADVAAARVIEAPPALAGGQTLNVLAFARRQEQNAIGFHLLMYSQIDGSGNYVDLETQRSFATQCTLAADLAASTNYELTIAGTVSASVLQLVVSPQIDLSIFNLAPPGSSGANDDQLLLFLVGTSSGLVSEDSAGAANIEVISLSDWSVVSTASGTVTYAVHGFRARRGTVKRAFAASTTEAWVIARSQLMPVTHADFATLLSNRQNGVTPTNALFRFQVTSNVGIRSESDCADHGLRFATGSISKPTLTWSSPGVTAWPYTFATSAGGTLNVNGSWSDADGNIVSYSLAWRAGNDPSTEVPVFTQTVSAQPQVFWTGSINFAASGTYTVIARATDSFGLSSDVAVAVVVPQAGGGVQTALPAFSPYNALGYSTTADTVNVTVSCATSGAQLTYAIFSVGQSPTAVTPGSGAWSAYAVAPITVAVAPSAVLWACAHKAGNTDSGLNSATYLYRNGGGFGPR